MNRYKLSKAGISATEGITRFNGSVEIYEKMLNRFPRDEEYGKLTQAIACGDVKAALTAAHSLKGMAGNLSMNRLYEDIVPLVEELRGGSLERAEELLQPVTADYEAIIEVLA